MKRKLGNGGEIYSNNLIELQLHLHSGDLMHKMTIKITNREEGIVFLSKSHLSKFIVRICQNFIRVKRGLRQCERFIPNGAPALGG